MQSFENGKSKGGKRKQYSIDELDQLILSIKQAKGLTEEQIAQRAGYNEGYISQTRSRGVIPAKFIETIKREFSQLIPPPPISGLGTPVYDSDIVLKKKDLTYNEYETKQPDFFIQIPQYRDCDYGTRASGDTMYPEIRNGDLLICKQVEDLETIIFGDIYLLQLSGGQETVKYIHPHEDENFFLLKARHESVPDTPMSKKRVVRVYKVRGVFKGY